MQSAETQSKIQIATPEPDRVGDSSIPVGCVSKKWLFFKLRPSLTKYRPDVVRIFFTSERMERCNIDPEKFKTIKIFSPEATHVIVSDLKKYGFFD